MGTRTVATIPTNTNGGTEAFADFDLNDNGKISCRELRKAGESTPIYKTHPAYPYLKDRDNDGWACEPWLRKGPQ